MILQALTSYYEALRDKGVLSAPGWDDNFKVSYELRLNDSGQLVRLMNLGSTSEKGKLIPRPMRVPKHSTRSSGILANFLCDTSSYLLGADEKGKPERAIECFKASSSLHHTILDGVDSPVAKAILAFFDHWNPAQAATHPLLAEQWKNISSNANIILGYEDSNGHHEFSIESDIIQVAWEKYYNNNSADAFIGPCLVTGKEGPIERTHPNISGFPGAQSSGASLVSFNASAFCSYGHEQGSNAPVSKYAAFAYTTALNYLLSDRKKHCRIIGKGNDVTAVVCWAKSANPIYSQVGCDMMFFGSSGEMQESTLFHIVKCLSIGQPYCSDGITLSPEEHFYVLGISPNAARLSVRFFLQDTFGSFAQNLTRFWTDTEIARPIQDTRQNLSVWSLAMTTVRTPSTSSSLPSPSPQLVGDLLRSVLTGGHYPATLLSGVTLRIRAEHNVSRGRAAALKAYYLRNRPNVIPEEVLIMSLNESSSYSPYVLGRLFSVLESVQYDANPNIKATIKDCYFNSACATPALAFPTLIKLSQKHLQKLPKERAIFYRKLITELMGRFSENGFPARLSLPEQGAFEIGYYHQTQKRYAKKNEEE